VRVLVAEIERDGAEGEDRKDELKVAAVSRVPGWKRNLREAAGPIAERNEQIDFSLSSSPFPRRSKSFLRNLDATRKKNRAPTSSST